VNTNLWDKVTFGRTGLHVSRIALGSSYGIGGKDIERAVDRGINFLFYGLRRTGPFADGVRALASRRDELVIAIQSYSRSAMMVCPSVDFALRKLRIDHADMLGLGWWNEAPPRRILDAALAVQAKGKVRHLVISSHHRPTFEKLMADPAYGGIMLRYSAAHPGAEREVFPHLSTNPPGVLAFTATRWGTMLDPAITHAGVSTPSATDCYRFVLSNPSVHTSLAGPRDGAELDGAMAALDKGPMDADELAWMKRVGEAVRRDAKKESPVAILDRLQARFRASA
jgi:aryl-alcohol dehydrogenase-like predicted oxidoreductase